MKHCKGFLPFADATEKLERWRLRLSDFEFDIVHRAGINHQAADALQHFMIRAEDQTPLNDEVVVPTISWEVIACASRTETPSSKLPKNRRAHFSAFLQMFL